MTKFAVGLRSFAATGLLLASCNAAAYAKHFEAHCQADEGGKFVLRAQYDYRPAALWGSARVAKVQDWAIYFRASKRMKRVTLAPASLKFTSENDPDCHLMGRINGVYVVNMSYLRDDGTWFSPQRLPHRLTLSGTPSEQPEQARARLKELGLSPSFGFGLVVPRGPRLVYEQPLLSFSGSENGIIKAVYRSVSADNGKTWSPSAFSNDSEHFEVGKSLQDQAYAARIVSGGTVISPR